MISIGSGFLGLTRERFPWRWSAVLTWGGLRGALPMVLVLSLPKTLPYRDLLISMTFGVALLSILVQGLTMSGLLKLLGLLSDAADRTAYEVRTGRLQAAAAALDELERMSTRRVTSPAVLEALRTEYAQEVQTSEQQLKELGVSSQELQKRDAHRIRRHLLEIERDRIMEALHHGALGRASVERLLADIDARRLALETGHEKPSSGSGKTAPERTIGKEGVQTPDES